MSILIEKDSIWEDSFYDLTKKGVAVFPNATLTIQGGTKESPIVVRFANETAINLQSFSSLVIEGHVHFNGTEPNKDFSSLSHNGRGIQIVNSDGPANIFIAGLRCSYMTNCIGLGESRNSILTIRSSIFEYNDNPINGDLAVDARVDVSDSLFLQNYNAIFAQNPSIYNIFNCTFLDDVHGKIATYGFLSVRASVNVEDSSFQGLYGSIESFGIRAKNCTFKGNKGTAINVAHGQLGADVIIQDCIFEDNGQPIFHDAQGGFYVNNSLFLRNADPVEFSGQVEKSSITNSVFAYFKKARGALKNKGFGNISSSMFIGNQIGIDAYGTNQLYIDDSIFYQNDKAMHLHGGYEKLSKLNFIDNTVAIRINTKTSNAIGTMLRSNFRSSNQYNVQLDDHPSSSGTGYVNLTNLYWGSTNITEIRSKVYDIHQDASVGLAKVEPVATNPFPNWDWTPPKEFLGVPLLREITVAPSSMPVPTAVLQPTVTSPPSRTSKTTAPTIQSKATRSPTPDVSLLSTAKQHDDGEALLECSCTYEHLALFLSLMLNICFVVLYVVGRLKKQTRPGRKETCSHDDYKEENVSLMA